MTGFRFMLKASVSQLATEATMSYKTWVAFVGVARAAVYLTAYYVFSEEAWNDNAQTPVTAGR